MKSTILAMTVLAAFACTAQTSTTPSTTSTPADSTMQQSGSNMSGQSGSMSSSSSAGSGQTYDGCIKEKHGKYMLMTMNGQKYMLNSTQDLSAHKGHEVKVTGDVSGAMSGGAMSEKNESGESSATEKNENMASEKGESSATEKNENMKGMQTLNVTNLDMVSTTCDMSHMKGGMSH